MSPLLASARSSFDAHRDTPNPIDYTLETNKINFCAFERNEMISGQFCFVAAFLLCACFLFPIHV